MHRWKMVYYAKIFFIPIWIRVSELNYHKARAIWWLDVKTNLIRRK